MKLAHMLGVAVAALFAGHAHAVTVASNNTAPTTLGAVVAGQSYTLTAKGLSDLFASFNGGQGLRFTADGVPTYPFPSPYSGFNPNGSDNDPTSGINCVGGAGLLCGALIGGYSLLPGGVPMSYIQLGSNYSFTATQTGFLVGLVNDVPGGYGDNAATGFDVTLELAGDPGAVPEPATWAIMLLGFGAAGYTLRRRRPVEARIRFA